MEPKSTKEKVTVTSQRITKWWLNELNYDEILLGVFFS